MKFLQKRKEGAEWKRIEQIGSNLNTIDSNYSKSISNTFNLNFINLCHIIYQSKIDPFLKFQHEISLYSSSVLDKIGVTIFANGCFQDLKKMHFDFLNYKEQFQMNLEESRKNGLTFSQTNQMQDEYKSQFNQYQKSFVTILVANLGTSADAQAKFAHQSKTISSNLLELSKEIAQYPQIHKVSVDIAKLKKKIQKNNEMNNQK